jgi:hypothetical protein
LAKVGREVVTTSKRRFSKAGFQYKRWGQLAVVLRQKLPKEAIMGATLGCV